MRKKIEKNVSSFAVYIDQKSAKFSNHVKIVKK